MSISIQIDDKIITLSDSMTSQERGWGVLAGCAALVAAAALTYIRPLEGVWLIWIVGFCFAFVGLLGLSEPDRYVVFCIDNQQLMVTLAWPLLRRERSAIIPFSSIQSIGVEDVSDGYGYGGTDRWVVTRSTGIEKKAGDSPADDDDAVLTCNMGPARCTALKCPPGSSGCGSGIGQRRLWRPCDQRGRKKV